MGQALDLRLILWGSRHGCKACTRVPQLQYSVLIPPTSQLYDHVPELTLSRFSRDMVFDEETFRLISLVSDQSSCCATRNPPCTLRLNPNSEQHARTMSDTASTHQGRVTKSPQALRSYQYPSQPRSNTLAAESGELH
jgi:hypothetical protein